MGWDIAIVVLVSALAIALHVILFVVFRRWMDRDLALSFAGDDPARRARMLERLRALRREGVRRRDLPARLEREAAALQGAADAADAGGQAAGGDALRGQGSATGDGGCAGISAGTARSSSRGSIFARRQPPQR